VTFIVTATDNCGAPTVVSVPPSGSTFPVGVTQVTAVATDASGNQSSCTFAVTVLDQEPPSITCPPDLTTNTVPGGHSVTNIALGTPVTADNCGVAAFASDAPAIFPEGTNFVTWIVTDYSGNTNSCRQQIVVVPICSGVLDATGVVSQTTCAHRPVVFEVTASSPEPITYRWLFKDVPMASQTNRTLILPDPDESQAGNYTLEARTECALARLTAQLTVLPTPTNNPVAFTNANPVIIDEFGQAVPYGAAITPQCVPGVVSGLTVNLYGFSHRYPDDVSVVLAGPDGRQIKLMGRAGGNDSVLDGVNLTFSDDAADPLPRNDQIVSGIYLPTDYDPNFSLPSPADGPYRANLADFVNINPNGPWRLYAYDGTRYDGGQIASWSLNLEWRTKTLVLRNPTRLASGAFQVEVWGVPGQTTIIERSTNLSAWTPVATNVFATEKGIFTDPSPPSPRSFYRAWQP
jgi:hypothetical protein